MSAARRNDLLSLALLASIVTALFIDVLAGANVLYLRDLLHYAHPNKKVLREVVLAGEFPYWNRSVGGGQPLAANPAHEVFYPLTWLILLPPFEYAFQLFILVHLYLAAFGMYAFLRSLGTGPPAAFLGALSFSLGGITLSYTTLLPLLAAMVWMPPALLFARRFLLRRSFRDFALAAIFFGMQLLVAEPTTVLQTGILLGLYAIYRGAIQRDAIQCLRNVGAVAAISMAALLVSAVATLPMIDHARDSVRSRPFPFSIVAEWSTPPERVAELLYPHALGHTRLGGRSLYWAGDLYPRRGGPFAPSIYPGLLVTVCAMAGLLARVRGAALFAATAAMSFLLALGDHTPLWRLLYDIGLVRSMRYPEKFVLMGIVAVIVFATRTLDRILAGDERARRMALLVAAVTTAIAAAWAALAVSPWHAPLFSAMWKPPRSVFLEMVAAARSAWIVAAARGLLLIVLLRALARAPRPLWLAITALFLTIDLALLLPELAPRTDSAFFREPPPVLRQLPRGRDQYRLFHHGAWHRSRPPVQQYFKPRPEEYLIYRNAAVPLIPIAHGVQTAIDIDYDRTALLPTTDFVDSVWKLSDLTPRWLEAAAAMSNVRYRAVFRNPDEVFAAAERDLRALQPVAIIENAHTPRYSFASRLVPVRDPADFVARVARGFVPGTAYVQARAFAPAPGVVRSVRETANTARIEVETAGRAFLVMSVTPHKYWTVTIDGAEAEAVVTNVGYQGVVIPSAGRHRVEMRYRNPLIAVGAAISVAALLALGLKMRAL